MGKGEEFWNHHHRELAGSSWLIKSLSLKFQGFKGFYRVSQGTLVLSKAGTGSGRDREFCEVPLQSLVLAFSNSSTILTLKTTIISPII